MKKCDLFLLYRHPPPSHHFLSKCPDGRVSRGAATSVGVPLTTASHRLRRSRHVLTSCHRLLGNGFSTTRDRERPHILLKYVGQLCGWQGRPEMEPGRWDWRHENKGLPSVLYSSFDSFITQKIWNRKQRADFSSFPQAAKQNFSINLFGGEQELCMWWMDE